MIGKIEKNPQLEMFKVPLKHFINENHELVLMSLKINWEQLESGLSIYYCEDNGRPGIPIRTIAGIVLLKRIFDQSEECTGEVGRKPLLAILLWRGLLLSRVAF